MKLLFIFAFAVVFEKQCSSQDAYIVKTDTITKSTNWYKKEGNCIIIEEHICSCTGNTTKKTKICGNWKLYINKKSK